MEGRAISAIHLVELEPVSLDHSVEPVQTGTKGRVTTSAPTRLCVAATDRVALGVERAESRYHFRTLSGLLGRGIHNLPRRLVLRRHLGYALTSSGAL